MGLVVDSHRLRDAVEQRVDATPAPRVEPSHAVRRSIWQSRYGAIVIEVAGDDVFVNGQRVEPHTR